MKLLFIQGGSRVRCSTNGTFYVDGNFNNEVWKRYNSYCSNLTVILRKTNENYDESELNKKFNKIDLNLLNLKLVDDIYKPKKNFFNFMLKRRIKKEIEEEVKKADKIIIRSIGNFYTNTALKYCKKYKKSYLIEVTGFAFEGLWYHSFFGKIVALPRELKLRKSIKDAPFALYVSTEALQNRYPCNGETCGCSDVELEDIKDEIINERISQINSLNENKKIILGTAAFLDVKWKGQENVIKALSMLKKNGIDKFEYQLIGAGSGKELIKNAKKYDILENVKIIGTLKHDEVFKWLDKIDIYVQPSYQEGLCRSIVEAMSRGCPVICSDLGGNYELIDKEYIYNKKSINELANILKLVNKEQLEQQAKINFNKAKKFQKDILDVKRDNFYKMFINNKE